MTRFLWLLVLVVTLVLAGASPEAAPAGASAATGDPVQGDVTCDSTANSIDSLQILRSVAGLSTSAACLADAGDVDCDGDVNSVDSLRILRYVAGLTNTTPDGCVPIGEPLEVGLNSYQLIQAALDAGDIDAETALTYKIFVTFSDPRLPAEYHGDDSQVWDDPGAVAELVGAFDTLSPATHELLAPFLLPAYAPGSWQQQRATGAGAVQAQAVQYLTVETSPRVKVWYQQDRPQDQAVAQGLANEVDGTIWTELTSVMGDPKGDGDQPNNGGDGRIDIILSGDPLRSFAAPYACKAASAIVTLGSDDANKYVLTHELMHVVTFHFNVQTACEYPEYRWFNEATSQWAIDLVYKDSQEERNSQIPSCFLDHPALPLEHRNDCHEYAAYLLPFYLHRNHDKQYVRKIWDAFAGNNSLGAVNAALGPLGGLKGVWPKFTTENYNRELQTKYKTDGMTEKAVLEVKEGVSLGGGAIRKYVLRGDVDHLAAFYHEYTFVDPAIREVTFKHSLKGQPTAFVRALVKYEGDNVWKIEDWTPDEEKKFCYDDPGQKKFEKLVIIISNSEYQNRSHVLQSSPQPELIVEDQCGLVDIRGWAESTITIQDGSRNLTFNSGRVDLVFKPRAEQPVEGAVEYDLEPGQMTWTVSGTISDCTAAGTGIVEFKAPDPDFLAWGYMHVVGPEDGDWHGLLVSAYNPDAHYTVTCPDRPPYPYVYEDAFGEGFLLHILSRPNTEIPGGVAYKGTCTLPDPPPQPDKPGAEICTGVPWDAPMDGRRQTFKWDLRPATQPAPPPP